MRSAAAFYGLCLSCLSTLAGESSIWSRIEAAYRKELPAEIQAMKGEEGYRAAVSEFRERDLESLSADDHLNAARELCKIVRTSAPHRKEEELLASAAGGLAMCLGHFPAKSGQHEGMARLFALLEDKKEDVLLRLFVVLAMQSAPPFLRAPMSQFAASDRDRIAGSLRGIARDKHEPSCLREGAMRSWEAVLRDAYLDEFRKDPNVMRRAAETRRVVDPEEVMSGNLGLDAATVGKLEAIEGDIMEWVDVAEGMLGDTQNPERLRNIVRFLMSVLYEELPLKQRRRLKTVIDKYELPPTPQKAGNRGTQY